MSSPHWHPILDLVDVEPGYWLMMRADGQPYGEIRLVRVDDGTPAYRAEHRGAHLGWGQGLREACDRIAAAERGWGVPGLASLYKDPLVTAREEEERRARRAQAEEWKVEVMERYRRAKWGQRR